MVLWKKLRFYGTKTMVLHVLVYLKLRNFDCEEKNIDYQKMWNFKLQWEKTLII